MICNDTVKVSWLPSCVVEITHPADPCFERYKLGILVNLKHGLKTFFKASIPNFTIQTGRKLFLKSHDKPSIDKTPTDETPVQKTPTDKIPTAYCKCRQNPTTNKDVLHFSKSVNTFLQVLVKRYTHSTSTPPSPLIISYK